MLRQLWGSLRHYMRMGVTRQSLPHPALSRIEPGQASRNGYLRTLKTNLEDVPIFEPSFLYVLSSSHMINWRKGREIGLTVH